jgi:hypothetical protein
MCIQCVLPLPFCSLWEYSESGSMTYIIMFHILMTCLGFVSLCVQLTVSYRFRHSTVFMIVYDWWFNKDTSSPTRRFGLSYLQSTTTAAWCGALRAVVTVVKLPGRWCWWWTLRSSLVTEIGGSSEQNRWIKWTELVDQVNRKLVDQVKRLCHKSETLKCW